MEEDTMEDIRIIHIAADHAGFDLKNALVDHLEKAGYEVQDHGAHELDLEDDFTDFIPYVAREININPEARGIIIGGSGQGEAMAANRFPGVRVAVFYGEPEVRPVIDGVEQSILTLSRTHNDANVLSLGARFMSEEEGIEAVDTWLETAFSGKTKYVHRNSQLDQLF